MTTKSQEDVFGTCSKCNLPIRPGDEIWSFNLNQEVEEPPPVTVLWAQALEIFCEKCASPKYHVYTTPSRCIDCDVTFDAGGTKWVLTYDKERVVGSSTIDVLSNNCLGAYCEQCAKQLEVYSLVPCCPIEPARDLDSRVRPATLNEVQPLVSGGCGLCGFVTTTFRRLVQCFGEPNNDNLDEYKDGCQWTLIFEDKLPIWIYPYAGRFVPDGLYEWHIGSCSRDAVDRVAEALKEEQFRYIPPFSKRN